MSLRYIRPSKPPKTINSPSCKEEAAFRLFCPLRMSRMTGKEPLSVSLIDAVVLMEPIRDLVDADSEFFLFAIEMFVKDVSKIVDLTIFYRSTARISAKSSSFHPLCKQ